MRKSLLTDKLAEVTLEATKKLKQEKQAESEALRKKEEERRKEREVGDYSALY